MELGNRIAVLRAEQQISQSELADACQTTTSQISRIESGATSAPSVLLVAKIAANLNVSLDVLVQAPDEVFLQALASPKFFDLSDRQLCEFLGNFELMLKVGAYTPKAALIESLRFSSNPVLANFSKTVSEMTGVYAVPDSLSMMGFSDMAVKLIRSCIETGSNMSVIAGGIKEVYEEEFKIKQTRRKSLFAKLKI